MVIDDTQRTGATQPPRTRIDHEVVVVGGGPAGSAAAITLARAGVDVAVVDKARFPRDKCCGDGLTTGALRTLEELGFDPRSVPSWQQVDDIVVRGPRARSVEFPLPRNRGMFAAVARRAEFDAALLDVAAACGATIHTDCPLSDAMIDRNAIEVRLIDRSPLRARFTIGADGMWSPLRRALGREVAGYRGDWHAFRQYFTDVAERARHELMIFFDADLLPGYAWSFPLADGSVNFGFGMMRGVDFNGAMLNRRWDDLIERRHIRAFLGPDARPVGQRKAWPIPTRLPGPALTTDRAFFVGDAAALGDPMTGEGIGQALASGRAAAQSIIAHRTNPTVATAHYESWVHQNLTPDTRMAMLLSRALAHRKGARAAIATAGLTPWTRRNFARWLFEDEPRGVLFTPNRLHRRFLRRDGAYGSLGD